MNLENLIRENVKKMSPYSSARDEFEQFTKQMIYLDANENPFTNGINRYPDPHHRELKAIIADKNNVSKDNIILGNGSDEVLDLIFRAFCEPNRDNIITLPPTYGMYGVLADINAVQNREVLLNEEFQPNVDAILNAVDANTKIIFLCSPNNPTANVMDAGAIQKLCETYADTALIVVDETYIEFSDQPSSIAKLDQFANLVVLRTLSKSHAAAGLRCGAAVARGDVTSLLQKVLAPYPLAAPVMQAALTILKPENTAKLAEKRADIVTRRNGYAKQFASFDDVHSVLPSDANYLLLLVRDAADLCEKARKSGIILRDQSHQPGLKNAVRIAIGSAEEMQQLLAVLAGENPPALPAQRRFSVTRKTSETAISVTVNLDKTAPVKINTGVGFYDHMLDQIAKHGGFSLELECDGDLHIDPHHSVEDCAIALGQAIRGALGDKRGIGRYGFFLPMDESLVQVALDFGGRFYLDFKADFPESHVGDLPCDMVPHVFYSLAEHMQANLHIAVTGENTHHMVEACFKGFGRALRQAIRIEGTEMPSTKGTL
jgi:histidinol-phosphate aminotransferase